MDRDLDAPVFDEYGNIVPEDFDLFQEAVDCGVCMEWEALMEACNRMDHPECYRQDEPWWAY